MLAKLLIETLVIWLLFFLYVWLSTVPLGPVGDSCGTEDFLLAPNRAFTAELTELGADVTWKEVPGFGHEWRFWDQQVEAFLDWLPREDVYAKMGKRSC